MPPTIIAGNITDDPDLRSTQRRPIRRQLHRRVHAAGARPGKQRWKDGETIFLRYTAWWAAAENAAQSLHKGDRVLVAGRLR